MTEVGDIYSMISVYFHTLEKMLCSIIHKTGHYSVSIVYQT